LKINRIMPFCNLFMGRPSYKSQYQVQEQLHNRHDKVTYIRRSYKLYHR